jgi:hypothetical protein
MGRCPLLHRFRAGKRHGGPRREGRQTAYPRGPGTVVSADAACEAMMGGFANFGHDLFRSD